MDSQKELMTTIVVKIAKRLQDKELKWLVGGSGSLMIHGVAVVPNDIDIVADPADYENVVNGLGDYVTGPTVTHDDTKTTPFQVDDVECEVIMHSIDPADLDPQLLNGVTVPVYKLENEYQYYKKRAEEGSEKSAKKLPLIEEVLNRNL